jgi:hypothetical protein
VVHLVNRDYDAMARDYYALDFLDRSVDVRPIVPALAAFFDDVLEVCAYLTACACCSTLSPRTTHMPSHMPRTVASDDSAHRRLLCFSADANAS